MKCPKCEYLGFDTGDRCRNCGYNFSLAVAVEADRAGADDGYLTAHVQSPNLRLCERGAAFMTISISSCSAAQASRHERTARWSASFLAK